MAGDVQINLPTMFSKALAGEECLACPAVDRAFQWLFAEGRTLPDLEQFVAGLTRVLTAGGFPLLRLFLGLRTLHPQIAATAYIWNRGTDKIEVVSRDHAILNSPVYMQSPLRELYENRQTMIRRRLAGPGAKLDYPVLDDMKKAGATDYAVFALSFGGEPRGSIAITTDQPEGFADFQIDGFLALIPLISLIVDARESQRMARSLLSIYLGGDAGQRVLGGLVQRGDSRTIAAAIWYCDLRDFTAMSNELPRDEVIAVLNDYFDTMAQSVYKYGGEILKFIGDAMLAIFPMLDDLDRDNKCRIALAAAEEALDSLRDLNDLRASAGKKPLRVGIGLHAGSVSYGNIGALIGPSARLDFTVIGPAVNLAARIEGLCRELDRPLIASRALASPCGSKLVSLGKHSLRGFAKPQEVFGLPD
jgi:adenylate cyclase